MLGLTNLLGLKNPFTPEKGFYSMSATGDSQVGASKPTAPVWLEDWLGNPGTIATASYDYTGEYRVWTKGYLWWRKVIVVYEYRHYIPPPSPAIIHSKLVSRKLAEFKTLPEAKNYVETVWRMQAAGSFNPRGEVD